MGTSLRDQLVQAGLASKNDARRAAKQQRKQARQNVGDHEQRAREEERARAAKIARDRELERERKASADKKAKHAEVRQLIEAHRLPPMEGEEHFNFVDGGTIRRLPVTAERRERIVNGALSIVRDGGGYALVPLAVAERIRERDADAVLTLEPSARTETDDAYKDYVVPDDLIW